MKEKILKFPQTTDYERGKIDGFREGEKLAKILMPICGVIGLIVGLLVGITH